MYLQTSQEAKKNLNIKERTNVIGKSISEMNNFIYITMV